MLPFATVEPLRVGLILVGVLTLLAVAVPAARPGASQAPSLRFTVGASPALKLTDVIWTGTRFFYVENTTNKLFVAGPDGKTTGLFATMPNVVEETRCVPSPSRFGYPKGGLFCHSPDNRIYRVTADGTTTVFATLPDPEISDGALAVDRVGRFGHLLVAATGRSGASGGDVYTIDATGAVRKVGSYPGPGGAENIAVAPATFGSQAGSVLITIDQDNTYGSLLAMDPNGAVTAIARFPDGANPIAFVPSRLRKKGVPPAGFYVVDTGLGQVLFASADQFSAHAGAAIVGTEVKGQIWLVEPSGAGFETTQARTNLSDASYNLEGAKFVP